MLSAKEYRELADECLGWARTAKSDKEHRIFLQMAEAWLEVVARRVAQNQSNKEEPRSQVCLLSSPAETDRRGHDPGGFPTPWVAEDHGAFFTVRDSNHRTLLYVHFADGPGSAASLLTRAEAKCICCLRRQVARVLVMVRVEPLCPLLMARSSFVSNRGHPRSDCPDYTGAFRPSGQGRNPNPRTSVESLEGI